MKLIFGKMTMHNFMVFEDESFDFSENSGMVMIRGKNNDLPDENNGAGKSTIGYALLYALFGDTQSVKKNENIVCWTAKDRNLKVTLAFSSDSKSYRIERGLERGRTSFFNLYLVTDADETNITKSSIAETQQFLETEILHCDISIFLRTMLLTANQTYNFYMLKKQDKKEFIEKLFDIQAFGDMYTVIHKDILQLDKKAVAMQNQLLILNRNMSDFEQRSRKFNEDRTAQISELKSKLSAAVVKRNEFADKHVSVNTQAVEKLENAIETIDAAIDSKRRELMNSEKTLSKIATAGSKLKRSSTNDGSFWKNTKAFHQNCVRTVLKSSTNTIV